MEDGGTPSLDNYEGSVTISYDTSEKSLDEAIRDARLDPEEWIPTKAHITQNGKSVLRIEVRRRLLRPARAPIPHIRYQDRKRSDDQIVKKVVICSDQQWPYHDRGMQEQFCEFLYRNRPISTLICNGDGFDFPEQSSYDPNPRLDTHINVGLDAGVQCMYEWCQATSPETDKYYNGGNHEQRFIKYLQRHAPAIQGLRRGGTTDEVLTLPFLAQLDVLGFKFSTGPYNDWPEGRIELAPGLFVAHGWTSRTGSGASARAHIEQTGVSLIMGHTHRLAQVYLTHQFAGVKLVGVEGGTMCQIKDGLGYAVSPDWQNGFVVVTIFEDGSYKIDLVEYDPETRKLKYGTWK